MSKTIKNNDAFETFLMYVKRPVDYNARSLNMYNISGRMYNAHLQGLSCLLINMQINNDLIFSICLSLNKKVKRQ